MSSSLIHQIYEGGSAFDACTGQRGWSRACTVDAQRILTIARSAANTVRAQKSDWADPSDSANNAGYAMKMVQRRIGEQGASLSRIPATLD